MLISGKTIEMITAIIIVMTLYLIMKKFIDLTKISKGSNYGEKKKN